MNVIIILVLVLVVAMVLHIMLEYSTTTVISGGDDFDIDDLENELSLEDPEDVNDNSSRGSPFAQIAAEDILSRPPEGKRGGDNPPLPSGPALNDFYSMYDKR